MKTEEFDELIRKKLEDLPQQFTESQVDKVFEHVAGRSKPFFRFNKGYGLSYTMLAVAFTGFLTWQLLQKSSTTKQAIATDVNLPANTLLPVTSGLTSPLTDSLKKNIKAVSSPIQAVDQIDSESKKTNQSIANHAFIPIPVVAAEEPKHPEIHGLMPDTTTAAASPEPDLKPNVPQNEHSLTENLPKTIPQQENPSDQTPDVATASDKKDKKTKRKTGKKVEEKPSASTPTDKKLPLSEQANKPKKTQENSQKFDLQFYTGLAGGVGLPYYRASVLGGVVIQKHWNIESGFGILYTGRENFKDEDDYFDHTSRPFKDDFEHHTHAEDQIDHINTTRTIFQIPVSVRYQFSFGNQWFAGIGLGTSLDLYSRISTDFSRRTPHDSIPDQVHFSDREPTKVLNTIILEALIQKRWKQLSVEIMPYSAFQFKKLRYKDHWVYPGLDVRLNYFFRNKR